MAEKRKRYSIIEYAQTEMRTFSEKPLCNEDALVLSQLVYQHYESVVPSIDVDGESVRLGDMFMAEKFPQYFDIYYGEELNEKLFTAVCASPRFRDIKLNYVSEIFSSEKATQFFAITFILPDNTAFIAFRGTDGTIVGWEEDFNMFFAQYSDSQNLALVYLERVAGILPDSRLVLGGHSKGGSLAIYAATVCGDELNSRIDHVYNFDGPGLSENIRKEYRYEKMDNRITTLLPRASVIGVLMNDGEYDVVRSKKVSVLQHDPFSWMIEKGSFVKEKELKDSSEKINTALQEGFVELSTEERELVVKTVFDIIESVQVVDFIDFPLAAIKNPEKIVDAIKDVEPNTSEKVMDITSEILRILFKNMVDIKTPDTNNSFIKDIKKAFAWGTDIIKKNDNDDKE